MITDDPGTPGPGNWEINIAATAEHHASDTEGERPLLDINYGIGERIQLKYEVPWVAQRGDAGARSGLGNSLLGVKWRFYDAGETQWQVSTYPQVELRNPGSHSVRRGLAEEGTGILLPFEFQRAFTKVGVNFEFGRELRSHSEGEWFGGVVLGQQVSEAVELMTELHGEAAASLSRVAIAANLGARVNLSHYGTLLMSAGRDLHNGLGERAAVFGYIGWQFTSGEPARLAAE